MIPCPSCGSTKARVMDTRQSAKTVRRRRLCLSCDERWTTYEVTESAYAAISDLDAVLCKVAFALMSAKEAVDAARVESRLIREDFDLDAPAPSRSPASQLTAQRSRHA